MRERAVLRAGLLTVVSLWAAIPCRGFVLIGARGTASGSGHRPHPSASMRRTPPRMATDATDELDDDHPETYGVLTPGGAMGDALLQRLPRVGIRFEVRN